MFSEGDGRQNRIPCPLHLHLAPLSQSGVVGYKRRFALASAGAASRRVHAYAAC